MDAKPVAVDKDIAAIEKLGGPANGIAVGILRALTEQRRPVTHVRPTRVRHHDCGPTRLFHHRDVDRLGLDPRPCRGVWVETKAGASAHVRRRASGLRDRRAKSLKLVEIISSSERENPAIPSKITRSKEDFRNARPGLLDEFLRAKGSGVNLFPSPDVPEPRGRTLRKHSETDEPTLGGKGRRVPDGLLERGVVGNVMITWANQENLVSGDPARRQRDCCSSPFRLRLDNNRADRRFVALLFNQAGLSITSDDYRARERTSGSARQGLLEKRFFAD